MGALRPERLHQLRERSLRYGDLTPAEQAGIREYIRSVSAHPDAPPLDVELRGTGLANLELGLGDDFRATSPAGQEAEGQRGFLRRFQLRLSRPSLLLYEFALACHWDAS